MLVCDARHPLRYRLTPSTGPYTFPEKARPDIAG